MESPAERAATARSGIAVVVPEPVLREERDDALLGHELTPRQLTVVAESIYHGRHKDVAACLGISESTVKNHASAALAKTGASSLAGVAYALGWISVPPVLSRHGR